MPSLVIVTVVTAPLLTTIVAFAPLPFPEVVKGTSEYVPSA